MKIGILTFHSQLNYGGVLQCWALKEFLRQLGHDVVVLDRWLTADNRLLMGPFLVFRFRFWCSVLVRSLCGCGTWKMVTRSFRSIRFVKALGLTEYHFHDWRDAPDDLGINCLVVGSDQVWHYGKWSDPRPYLLEDAGEKIPLQTVAYAASFGMKTIPNGLKDVYRKGLSRFLAISCRENEGVQICHELGFSATHVVDPTLLLARSAWSRLQTSNLLESPFRRKWLVCYFMSVKIDEALPQLERFARTNDCFVKVLSDAPYLKPFGKSIRNILENFHNDYPHVRICSDYGPKEFVRTFSSATYTLTDSFHAVMFSALFEKNVRILLPDTELRRTMFARIEEFANSCLTGPTFADSVQQALDSLQQGQIVSVVREEISRRRNLSRAWLIEALKARQ